MEAGDWFNTTVNVVIGVLLGIAVHRLLQLVSSGSWLMAVIILLLAAGLFLLIVLSDKLFDRIFPTGIRPAKSPRPRPPKPLLRVLSLPSGLVLGLVLAVMGLDGAILDLLP